MSGPASQPFELRKRVSRHSGRTMTGSPCRRARRPAVEPSSRRVAASVRPRGFIGFSRGSRAGIHSALTQIPSLTEIGELALKSSSESIVGQRRSPVNCSRKTHLHRGALTVRIGEDMGFLGSAKKRYNQSCECSGVHTCIIGDDIVDHLAWVWGVPFAPMTKAETVAAVSGLVERGRPPAFFITANTHYVMLCENDPELRAINDRGSLHRGRRVRLWSGRRAGKQRRSRSG